MIHQLDPRLLVGQFYKILTKAQTHHVWNQIVPQKKISSHIEEEASHDAYTKVG